ncbi:Inner membrane protein yhjX [Serratia entomophila]|uniref:MFS transporter n=2 Tax=Serratia entomophila TaxID=42906 RepID=UPI00217865D7|nr:MFS transporter [Serratia entomophila]CAI0871961.1 Inner membrane protein yhjX [Serratia entomophila]CAI1513086.1 Inner membrane protein yhjX [Serratia entomophila]CAI1590771.1 Inner membrane protein yhjX [Serratia entomophila]CAI1822651.1 Inner membrane protein yhjX [Serratia entomophila]CAI1884120.1 Inner membrane protein yhjX [Serratia entomophila]
MIKGRQFRGWYMVGAVHLLLAVIFGAAYSFGAFFTALQTNFDAGRFSTASIFSLTALIYYAVGVFSGAWSDRTSVRTVTGIGILLLSLGFFGSSLLASSLTAFLLTFCLLVGVGVGLVYVPAVSTIQRWFVVHRSSASGLALAGTGLGTLVGPMVAGGLMQHLSWQSTLQVYAVAIAVLGLAAAFILRGRPEDVGEYPDGLRPVEMTSMQRPGFSGSVTLREAAGRAQFWWFFIAIFFGSIGLFLALVHINPYALQQGLNATQANLLIGLIGVGNIGGRLVLGRIGDRMGARRFLVIVTLSLAVLCGFWSVAHSFTALVIFALLFGAANGGCIALYPAVASTWFGTANLGAILGALYIAVGIAAVGGGSAAGWLYDLYQSYTLSIGLAGMAAILSALGIVLASRCNARIG